MKIAIVEDSPEYSATLLSFLQKYHLENQKSAEMLQYYTGLSFLDACQQEEFDIVFMDILMPGIDGMETARRFRSINENAALVFVTNMAQYAINGYDVGASDFIVKPISYINFSLKYARVFSAQEKKMHESIPLKGEEGIVFVEQNDIFYLESFGHYLTYHTKKGKIVTRQTFKEAVKVLSSDTFRQCAKSYIVNIHYVTKIAASSVFVRTETGSDIEISLSRKIKHEFISYLLKEE